MDRDITHQLCQRHQSQRTNPTSTHRPQMFERGMEDLPNHQVGVHQVLDLDSLGNTAEGSAGGGDPPLQLLRARTEREESVLAERLLALEFDGTDASTGQGQGSKRRGGQDSRGGGQAGQGGQHGWCGGDPVVPSTPNETKRKCGYWNVPWEGGCRVLSCWRDVRRQPVVSFPQAKLSELVSSAVQGAGPAGGMEKK